MVLLSSSDSKFLSNQSKFNLKSTQDTIESSQGLMGKSGLVVLFTCNHCPYAIALWNRLLKDYQTITSYGFNLVAINPNINPDYPDDSFEEMVNLTQEKKLPFKYLVDETQNIAKTYDAQCTPDLFVINNNHKLLYRGAYDDNWKDSTQVKEKYLVNALKEFNNGNMHFFNVPKSMGCSIKWVKS